MWVARLAHALVLGLLVAATAGCGRPPSVAHPSGSAAPIASLPPAPAASGAAGPSGDAGDCALEGGHVGLPSDRLVDLVLTTEPRRDVATFTLGAQDDPDGSASGAPRLEVSVAAPPFSQGGQMFDLGGGRFLELRFIGMATHDPSGTAVFRGPRDIETEWPALRQMTVSEEGGGLIAWYVGLDGPGCVTIALDPGGSRVVLAVAHDGV